MRDNTKPEGDVSNQTKRSRSYDAFFGNDECAANKEKAKSQKKTYWDKLSAPNPRFLRKDSDEPPRKKTRVCISSKFCPPRIDQLAYPTTPRMEGVLTAFHDTLEPERVVRIVKLIHINQQPKPIRHTVKRKQKKPSTKHLKKKAKKRLETEWLDRQAGVSAQLVMDFLATRVAYTPNYKQAILSLGLMRVVKAKNQNRLFRESLMKTCEQLAIIADKEWEPYQRYDEMESESEEDLVPDELKKHIVYKIDSSLSLSLDLEDELEESYATPTSEVEEEDVYVYAGEGVDEAGKRAGPSTIFEDTEEEEGIPVDGTQMAILEEPGEEEEWVKQEQEFEDIKEEREGAIGGEAEEKAEVLVVEEEAEAKPDYEEDVKDGLDDDAKEADEEVNVKVEDEAVKVNEEDEGVNVKVEGEEVEVKVEAEEEAGPSAVVKVEEADGIKEEKGEEAEVKAEDAPAEEERKISIHTDQGERTAPVTIGADGEEYVEMTDENGERVSVSVKSITNEEGVAQVPDGLQVVPEEEVGAETAEPEKAAPAEEPEQPVEQEEATAAPPPPPPPKKMSIRNESGEQVDVTIKVGEDGEEYMEMADADGNPVQVAVKDLVTEDGVIVMPGGMQVVEEQVPEEVGEGEDEAADVEVEEGEAVEEGEEAAEEVEEAAEQVEEAAEQVEEAAEQVEEAAVPEKVEEEKPTVTILAEHPEGTASYVVYRVYSSWLEEFGQNIQTYGTCLRTFREIMARAQTDREDASAAKHMPAIREVLHNWSSYLAETMSFETAMKTYFKGKTVSRCEKCSDIYSVYNLPTDQQHPLPDELKAALEHTVQWKQLLVDAEKHCKLFTAALESESLASSYGVTFDVQDVASMNSTESAYIVETVDDDEHSYDK